MKKALITGCTGQDGSYLTEFLLEKGYEVHGLKRRASSFNTDRVDHIFRDFHETDNRFYLHYADLTDGSSLTSVLHELEPDEIYNLGAQSHVKVSFEVPEFTADVDSDPAAANAMSDRLAFHHVERMAERAEDFSQPNFRQLKRFDARDCHCGRRLHFLIPHRCRPGPDFPPAIQSRLA